MFKLNPVQFVGQDATANVGGLAASSRDIGSADFMEGNHLFNEVDGAEGFVVNQGPLGKQPEVVDVFALTTV